MAEIAVGNGEDACHNLFGVLVTVLEMHRNVIAAVNFVGAIVIERH